MQVRVLHIFFMNENKLQKFLQHLVRVGEEEEGKGEEEMRDERMIEILQLFLTFLYNLQAKPHLLKILSL